MPTLQPFSFQDAVNFDGTYDGHWKAGDKPPTLSWNLTGAPSLLNKPQNVGVSFNARALLQGDGAALATITLVAVSGAGRTGWSDPGAGNTSTNNATVVASGSFLLRATYLSLVVDSPVSLAWSVVAAAQTAIRFVPGIRMTVGSPLGGNKLGTGTDSTNLIARMRAIIAKDTENKILGFEVFVRWPQLESQAGGVYDGSWDATGNSGFAFVDALIAEAQSYTPKRDISLSMYMLSSNVQTDSAGNQSFPTWLAPAYLGSSTYGTVGTNNFGGVYAKIGVGSEVKWWNSAVADRMARVWEALGARYKNNAAFYRMDPTAEMVALSGASPGGDYSESRLLAAMALLCPRMRAAFPATLMILRPTFVAQASFQTLFSTMLASHFSMANFDNCGEPPVNNGRFIWADCAYRGVFPVSGVLVTQPGWPNHVGTWDFHCFTNTDELGPRPPTNPFPPAKVGDGDPNSCYAHSVQQQASHIYYSDNTFTGPPENRTNVAPPNLFSTAIHTLAVPHPGYPSVFP